MSLRSFLDGLEHHFAKGGKFAWAYPAYEAIDTALYTPATVTGGAAHIRDALNLKRIMMTVWLAAFIPVFVGSYVVGYQANSAMADIGATTINDWRAVFLDALTGYDLNSAWDCLVHGLSYFVPLYMVVFGTGIAFEIWFASKRGHEVNEGFFVTSIFVPGQGPLPNAQSPSGFGQLDPKGKGDREARSWTTDFDFLWRSFGPERAQELMNMMAQFPNQQTAPAMQGYQQALGQYDQAYPAYQQAMQGVGQQYQQGMQGPAGQYENGMGGVGQDYASRMQQMAAMYAKQMGGAFQPAQQAMQQAASREYGAGLGAIGQGQNQINQSLAAQAARSGMGGTGVGQARTALGSAAGAFMMPQLQSQFANRNSTSRWAGMGCSTRRRGLIYFSTNP